MMGESPTCLLRSLSQPAASSGGLQEGAQDELMRALTSSISFGRYASETSFACEKWSSFTSNRYLEEAKKSSKPGSVKEMKAYFESHYKKIAANKAAALLEHPCEEEEEEEEEEGALDLNTEGSYEMEIETADSAVVEKENSSIPFPPKAAAVAEEGVLDLNTEGSNEMEMEKADSAVFDKENSLISFPPKAAAVAEEEEGVLDLNTEGSYEMEMEKTESIVVDKENSPIPFSAKAAAVAEEGVLDLNTEGSYEMEMEKTESTVVDKASVAEEEEEYKENIVNSPVLPKAAAEEEQKENIVNIPVAVKKPKAAVEEDKKKKKPINCFSKSSINGNKPSNPLPPPPPPPLRSSSVIPKPISKNKTPLPQIKKETSRRIQQIRKDDSILAKSKKTAGNLLKKISHISGPTSSFAAKHKELSQTITADNRKAKEKKRILPSPAKPKVQEIKEDKNNAPEKKRSSSSSSSSSSSTSITVGKKSDNSKTQLPTIDHHHQYMEKKKKKPPSVQEMSQRPPWRFSFKSSPERRNGGAESYPVNLMTPRKKRIFR